MSSEFDKYFPIGTYMNEYLYYNPVLQMCKVGDKGESFPSEKISSFFRNPEWPLSQIQRINKEAGLD